MIDPDGYRPNVGIVLMRPDGQLFWARRVNRDGWQFPQGGMNSDETPLEAMYRNARGARIYDGPDESHRMVVSRRILQSFKAGNGWDFGVQ